MKQHSSLPIKTAILPISFFSRPAETVAPELIGCILVKKLKSGSFLWGVIIETEAYSQSEPSCHGHTRRTKSNETLFGEPGRFYIYRTYGIHNCVNIVTYKKDWANGVLLRAIALPEEPERIAAGPALLARHFGLNSKHDNLAITGQNYFWLTSRPKAINNQEIVQTTRIGISKAKDLPWRWYLRASRSVSKREKGDRCPSVRDAWLPTKGILI